MAENMQRQRTTRPNRDWDETTNSYNAGNETGTYSDSENQEWRQQRHTMGEYTGNRNQVRGYEGQNPYSSNYGASGGSPYSSGTSNYGAPYGGSYEQGAQYGGSNYGQGGWTHNQGGYQQNTGNYDQERNQYGIRNYDQERNQYGNRNFDQERYQYGNRNLGMGRSQYGNPNYGPGAFSPFDDYNPENQYASHGNYSQRGGTQFGRYGQSEMQPGNNFGQGGTQYGATYGQNASQFSAPGFNQTGATHRGKGPKGYQRSDDRIREEISDRLTDDHLLDASDLEVTVTNGDVKLSGSVDSRESKRRAEDLAECISGVCNIENSIRVKQDKRQEGSATGMGANTPSIKTPANTAFEDYQKNDKTRRVNSVA